MGTFLIVVGFFGFVIGIVMLILALIRKKPKKKIAITTGVLFIVMFIGGAMTPTEESNDEVKNISKESDVSSEQAKQEKEDAKKKQADEAKELEKKNKEEEKKKKEAEKKAAEEKAAAEEAKKTPIEKIEDIIVKELDKKTNMDNDTIISIEDISEKQDGSYIIAKLNASENLTNNLTRSGIWIDSADILEPISKLETTNKIVLQWHLPLTDAYGETKNGQVMVIDLEREQLDKIKWDNFNKENFSVIANNYFEHPAFNQ